MTTHTPIACPECGDNFWYALEDYHATDRVNLVTAISPAISHSDNIRYETDAFDGWYCHYNDHRAPDDLGDQIQELYETAER